MALVPGTRLGPYEVVGPLGAGGMGEVYRARDTRLARDVALKILPQSFALDIERLRRFEQESRAVAAFNHPNILAIHDVGQHNGSPFLVSELLEGESLRAVLNRGALPQRKAIDYGVQIAQGLAIAHAKEIVHRDLKPENLFLTKDGRVKILDFGLAKAVQKTAGRGADSEGATVTSAQTAAGMVMGTASYMAPEQVRGESVDARTDIFAFGAVLYEMLSGHRAFRRDTSAETMTAVLKDDPPELKDPQHPISPALDRIVRRCLEKSPEQRFQSAKDVAFALEASSGTSHTSTAQAKVVAPRYKPLTVAVAVLCGIAALVGAYLAGRRSRGGTPTFQRLTFQRGDIRGARFAPDGQSVIYSASWEGRPYEVFISRIGDHYARSIDLKSAIVVGVSAAGDIALLTNVRRSPVSNWMRAGTLARVSESGGAAREILEDVWDADISRDGKQFAVVRSPSGPQQLEYPIGKILFKTNGYISHPRISPDGKLVAFLEHPVYGDDRGYLDIVYAGGSVKRLTDESSGEEGVAWSPDGREILYSANARQTSWKRVVFAVTPAGKSQMVFGVPEYSIMWDIASDGRVLLSHQSMSSAQMVASPANALERDVSLLGSPTYGALSADGKSIVFGESVGIYSGYDYAVFFRRLDGSDAVEIGEGSAIGITPDGKYGISFLPSQPTKLRILPTGAGDARTLDVTPIHVDRYLISWMPGAKEFVFVGHEGEAPLRGYRVSLQGGPAHPLTNQPGAHFWNRVSPDGRFVLEASSVANEPAQSEIVELATGQVRPAPLQQGDEAVGWDQDGAHAFVVVRNGYAEATIFRVGLASGKREVWKQIRPADPVGILSLRSFFVTPSGSAYTYSVGRVRAALYVYSQQ